MASCYDTQLFIEFHNIRMKLIGKSLESNLLHLNVIMLCIKKFVKNSTDLLVSS